MTKAIEPRKSSKAKAPTQKGREPVNPILDLFENMDENLIGLLQQVVQQEMDLGSANFGLDDPVDLFAEYLENCGLGDDDEGDVDEDEKTEFLTSLVGELSDLRVDSNGGDPEARGKIHAIYDLLDKALDAGSLGAVDIMMTGKILTDAGWAVPDNLKQALMEALQEVPPDVEGPAANDLVSSLSELVEQAGQNPFDVCEYLNSLLVALPAEASITLLSELVASKRAEIDQAVAGFLLHPDAELAQSVAEALATSATQTPVESSLIERLVRMRPWLPQTRQTQLDTALRVMRLNALPPVKPEVPKVIKCYVSVCDGTGTRSLFVTQRAGAHYQLVSVMMKVGGVAEALVLSELSKSEMDGVVRQMKSSVSVAETDLDGLTRMLRLAVADNLASGNPPPFKLVEVVESLGLGPVHPDPASPMDIITGLLADLPPEQTNLSATARAHDKILDSELSSQWFEAGEALEDLLSPVKGSKQRVAKLMKAYLPERRLFWARQCAISALAMHGDEKKRHAAWRQLALVGRDIASDLPLDQIPLMKQVAEISVRAFEGRRAN